MRLGILASHPIQYYSPWFRALAKQVDLEVFFAHRPDPVQQGSGFGKSFGWDVDLLSGYRHRFLENISRSPGVNHFAGCDTPEIGEIISGNQKAEIRKEKGKAESVKPEGGSLKAEDISQFQLSAFGVSRFDAFIVVGWYLKSFWQAIRACRRAGVPVLVRGDSQLLTPRSRLKRVVKLLAYRLLLRQFDGFLYVGQRNRQYLQHYGVPPEKLFFVPHFVDNEWFAAKAAEAGGRRSEIRTQWGVEENTFVVLFVGKFQPLKRQGDIIKALAQLKDASAPASTPSLRDRVTPANQTSNFLAIFIGSGELEAALREEAAMLKVRVHFAGFKNQSELPACYAAADVLVLPSDNETWGLVVNEAMACGIPAIVSNAVGCGPDMIEDGKTGFTFPAGDAAALAERLAVLAQMKSAGHDLTPALAEKMKTYSIKSAVAGTLAGLTSIQSRRKRL